VRVIVFSYFPNSLRLFYRASRDRKLAQYPHAFLWEASTWADFDRMWTLQCTEYHYHKEALAGQEFMPLSPASTPPSSPSELTASTPPRTPSPELASATTKRTNQERANDLPRTLAEGVKMDLVPHLAGPRPFPVPMTPRCTAPRDKFKLSREELDFLAATRPPPVPTSPQRLRQQFVHVLGPEAARPPASVGPSATPPLLMAPSISSPKKTRTTEATGIKAREPCHRVADC
jgi:hypothetical protein